MGEVFGQPTKKDWSPNEIVQKTSALKGMSGAVMSTDDGLLIAGQLPAPMKPDTLAAFLPQMFARMTQYGKELQLGDLNSMTLEFNKVPWYIVKMGPLFFAAGGKVGEPLPTSMLKVIASEMGKQQR
jgi:predicted regulator of Ras-like GTPase activity (Roadblock/LC7/MglB family)